MESEKKIGLAGKMAKVFIHNRQLGVLTIITLIFWGILSFVIMPKQYNPEIVAPAFNVITEFPGASSQEVYELITRPMEDKLKEISTVDKVMSQSIDGGVSVVTAQFYIGQNLEDAKVTLMQKLESNMEFKPMGAENPAIKAIDPDDVPIITLAITSSEYSEESLRKIAWDLGDQLKQIKDTSVVEVKGGRQKQLTISLDEGKMESFGISIDEIVRAIENNNLRLHAGDLKDDQNRFKVVIDGNIKNVQEAQKILLRQEEKSAIYLSDVADVSYDTGDIQNYTRFSQKDSYSGAAVYLSISKLKGSNAMTVSEQILERLDELKKDSIDSNISIEVVRNDGQVANEAVMSLTLNLFQAIAIVSLVLWFFLGWRSALVVSVAIPLTLASVFGVGNLAGQTINRITLFALILSLGLLVDSATVVVENIYRMLRENPARKKAEVIVEAVDEVGGGLVMSTLTTILAFYPMAFVTGMMGPYMGPIPFFVPAALVASLLIAFTVNPYLLDVLTKDNVSFQKSQKKKISLSGRIVAKLKNKYESILQYLLLNRKARNRTVLIVVILFMLSMSLPLLKIVKFRMLPKADKEQFYVYLDLPQYASIEKMNEISGKVENFILGQQEVESVQGFIGESPVIDFNGLFKGSDGRTGENQATLKVNLTHPDNRKETSEKIVLQMRPQLQDLLKDYPDARMKMIEDPPGPPVLSTFLIKIQGDNQEMLRRITKDIEHEAFSVEKVVDIDSTINEQTFEYVLRVNHEAASLAGLSSSQIAMTLRTILSGSAVGIFHQSSEDGFRKPEAEMIVVNFRKEDRRDKGDLDKIFISNNQGKKIPLSEVVTWERDFQFPTIYSDQQKKTMYISAEMASRSVTYGVLDAFKFLLRYRLPDGNGKIESWSPLAVNYLNQDSGERYSIQLDGEWKLTLEVFRDLGLAMVVAIFLIYFVLVAQFKSLKIPLLIMGTIPLAMIGVLPGFAILGWTNGLFFNATSMIGVIALAGIVVNNAIILLEYLRELQGKGYEIKAAILEAGKTRMLPIMLTSLTTILGSLTIISDPVWSGLAWAIIWGLSVSTFLTLIIFPILYYWSEKNNWELKNKH